MEVVLGGGGGKSEPMSSQQWTSRHHWSIVGHLWYNKCCQGNVRVCVYLCVWVRQRECERVAILMCVLFMKIHFCIHSTATKNVDHKVFCILFSVFSLLSVFCCCFLLPALLLLFMSKFLFFCIWLCLGFALSFSCPEINTWLAFVT